VTVITRAWYKGRWPVPTVSEVREEITSLREERYRRTISRRCNLKCPSEDKGGDCYVLSLVRVGSPSGIW
jgi:hypothetical protein